MMGQLLCRDLAAPLAAQAQQEGKIARVGVLSGEAPPSTPTGSDTPFIRSALTLPSVLRMRKDTVSVASQARRISAEEEMGPVS